MSRKKADAAGLMVPQLPQTPAITRRLRALGRDTLAHETNLARMALWTVQDRPVQGDLFASVLYGRPFRIVSRQRPTVADQRLYCALTDLFVREGCPEDRRVPFSLGWAARMLGHQSTPDDIGGNDRRLIRRSLARLRSVTLETVVRAGGEESALIFGLMDKALTTTAGGGKGWALLSTELAHLLRQGSVTFMSSKTWDAIRAQDQLAGRLWTFFEAESLTTIWRYSLFAAPPGRVAEERNMPAIAELLGLDWSAPRAQVARRVRQALAVIAQADNRYHLALVKGSLPGMWRVEAVKTKYLGGKPREALPPGVMGAWRAAYKNHRPSKKQVAALDEIIQRQGSLWVATLLAGAGPDPFAELLEMDKEEQLGARMAAIEREQAVADEKLAYRQTVIEREEAAAPLRSDEEMKDYRFSTAQKDTDSPF